MKPMLPCMYGLWTLQDCGVGIVEKEGHTSEVPVTLVQEDGPKRLSH